MLSRIAALLPLCSQARLKYSDQQAVKTRTPQIAVTVPSPWLPFPYTIGGIQISAAG
jgi:hypothetical protein